MKDGKLVYILENDMRIDDEVLQKELAHSVDHKMKNIVATIQKEQNAIVRDEKAKVLIVQGVAGSGKTSIALHRMAYLLYQNKEQLTSRNLLILSPNPIFSDYISDVLPELGEDNILQFSVQDFVKEELGEEVHAETKFEQLEFLLSHNNLESIRRKNIAYKQDVTYLQQLQQYVLDFPKRHMVFARIELDDMIIEKQVVEETFCKRFASYPMLSRVDAVADYLSEHFISISQQGKITEIRKQIRILLKKMIKETDHLKLYSQFLKAINEEKSLDFELIENKDKLYYEDIFPIIYLKYALNGYSAYKDIKHLLIDEMQDYSQIEFEILKMLFPCKMTILGDIHQVFESKAQDVTKILQEVWNESKLVCMNRSYRSTIEITRFASALIGQEDIIPFERHGERPSIKKATHFDEMIDQMQKDIKALDTDVFSSVAIICKNAIEARKVFEALQKYMTISLMTEETKKFVDGIVVTTSYLAKGLEFDVVCVPSVNAESYRNEQDRQVLYVSCTRALHRLMLYYEGEIAYCLEEKQN